MDGGGGGGGEGEAFSGLISLDEHQPFHLIKFGFKQTDVDDLGSSSPLEGQQFEFNKRENMQIIAN